MKNIIRSFLIFCTVIMLLINTVFADNSIYKEKPQKLSENEFYRKYEYVIDAYDINIKVNENNTLDVTEKITAYFYEPRIGIVRTIPAFERIEKDEDSQIRRCKLENVSINEDFKINKVNGNYEISIGSDTEKIVGEKEYIIKYTYDLGKDKVKGADEFNFDIIGDKWETVIGNVTFAIEMPKEFPADKLYFFIGRFKSKEHPNNNVSYKINDKIISGSLSNKLSDESAFTMQIELPEGYFNSNSIETDINFNFAYIIPLICFGITFFMWIIQTKGFAKAKTKILKFDSSEEHNRSEIKIGSSKLLSFCLFIISTIVYVYSFVAEYTESNKVLLFASNFGYFLLATFCVCGAIFFIKLCVELILNPEKNKEFMIFVGVFFLILTLCTIIIGTIYFYTSLLDYGKVYFEFTRRGQKLIRFMMYLKDLPIVFVMLSQSNYMIASLLGIICSIATFLLFILIKQKNKEV